VARWGADLGRRLIPAIFMEKPGDPSLEHLRKLIDSGKVRVLGEMALQYTGVSPADPAFEPYWALAEEKDIPVGIHIGPGPAGSI
jgi:predicted TIM-barrel fold metal-dependent hydrolase